MSSLSASGITMLRIFSTEDTYKLETTFSTNDKIVEVPHTLSIPLDSIVFILTNDSLLDVCRYLIISICSFIFTLI